MADIELRPVHRAEFPGYFRSLLHSFGEDPRDADREVDAKVFEPERSLAGFDGGEVVATSAIFSRDMTLPGGPRPVAAVTMVTVAPTHRRRGLLTEMMRRQLAELHDHRRESVAALWASEGGIYGRFGYGVASHRAVLTARTAELTLRAGTDVGSGQVRLATAEQARPHLAEVYEQVRGDQVGWLDRRDAWWDYRLYDPEHFRDGATALRFALYTEQDGRVTGYAIYRLKHNWDVGRNENEVQVLELTARTPQAYAATWSFLANLDLMPNLRKRIAPVDEPLQHVLANPRGLHLEVLDSLWVRLVDVGRALAERRYTRAVEVVFEVDDEFCPWNAGRWVLTGDADSAQCRRTQARPDLTLSSSDLATMYLGDSTLVNLAAAGRVVEHRPGAVPAVSRAFTGDRQPWCPEVF